MKCGDGWTTMIRNVDEVMNRHEDTETRKTTGKNTGKSEE